MQSQTYSKQKYKGLSVVKGGLFRRERPHFLVQKLRVFQNIGYVRTDMGGEG